MTTFLVYTLIVLVAGIVIGETKPITGMLRRLRNRRRPAIPVVLERVYPRDELSVPSVWRQRIARELVFGKARVIEADAVEVGRG